MATVRTLHPKNLEENERNHDDGLQGFVLPWLIRLTHF